MCTVVQKNIPDIVAFAQLVAALPVAATITTKCLTVQPFSSFPSS
ncbi:MAG: hypothetical protein DDT20_01091 [Firmicutes bacterium]|nr:hypothetical protein [Bacillota bacterium]